MTTEKHETGPDSFDPATHEAQDAQHFRRILAARKGLEAAEQELRDAVAAARAAGDSWAVIGAAMDTTRQGAFQRFGNEVDGEAPQVGTPPAVTPEDARAQLADVGRRLAAADQVRAEAMADLRQVVQEARNVVPIAHMAELAGVTRPTVYKALEDAVQSES
jgi:hypothetical protein